MSTLVSCEQCPSTAIAGHNRLWKLHIEQLTTLGESAVSARRRKAKQRETNYNTQGTVRNSCGSYLPSRDRRLEGHYHVSLRSKPLNCLVDSAGNGCGRLEPVVRREKSDLKPRETKENKRWAGGGVNQLSSRFRRSVRYFLLSGVCEDLP